MESQPEVKASGEMPSLSRILPLALVLPAAGIRSPTQAVVGEPDALIDSTYTVSWMAHRQAQGEANVTEYAPVSDEPEVTDLRPELRAAASSSNSVIVCVSQNKDLATDEWCTKLCKANVTQGAEAQAADPSLCDPDYCNCFDPEESREEQVKQVRQLERAQPSGLAECPYLAPEGCSASKPYECVAGPRAGQCSELNWFDRAQECELSCLHTKLLMFAPHSDTEVWMAGPVAPPLTTFRQQVPHYTHDPKKLTMGARGIEVRRLNVMLTPACKQIQPFAAVTLHSPAYTGKAKRLLRSCLRVGICCKATQAPNSFGPDALEGSEEFRFQLIAMKPAFILSQMELSRLPVVWLDADMEFHQFPRLFTPGSWPGGARDVALFNYWGNVSKGQNTPSLGSGVAFFNHTRKSRNVLTAWAEAMAYETNSRAPDDQVLNEIIGSNDWVQRASYGWLPVAYLRTMPVFYRGVDPVIDHDHGSPPGLIKHSPTQPILPPIETEQQESAEQQQLQQEQQEQEASGQEEQQAYGQQQQHSDQQQQQAEAQARAVAMQAVATEVARAVAGPAGQQQQQQQQRRRRLQQQRRKLQLLQRRPASGQQTQAALRHGG